MMIDDALLVRYARGIGLDSAPFLDALWTPREHQDATVAAMLGIGTDRLAAIRADFRAQLQRAADALLGEPAFAADAAALPFADGDRVLIVGDSLTADAVGWANILQTVLRVTSPEVVLLNRAVSGRTTAETLYNLPLTAPFEPTRALVMLGTNDSRRMGAKVGAKMASIAETEGNLDLVRQLLERQLGAREVILLTPPPVDADRVDERRGTGEWNEPADIAEVAEVVRRLDPRAIDVAGALRPGEGFFDVDGLHPTPEGQIELARVIARLLARRS